VQKTKNMSDTTTAPRTHTHDWADGYVVI